jgi:hypothetical protein
MTITNESRKVSYDIDGSSLFTYAYAFDIIDVDTVFLSFFDSSGVTVSVTMARTTNTSPSINEYYVNEDAGQILIGGSGTLQSQYDSDIAQLLITRIVDSTQEESFPVATALQTDSIETALDKNTMLVQQVLEEVSRSLKIPIQDDVSRIIELPSAAESVDSFLAFDSNGDLVVSAGTAENPISVAMQPVVIAATIAAARILMDLYSTGEVDAIAALSIKKDGSVAFTAAQSMGSNKLTFVTDPTVNQDAATKKYVDDNVGSANYLPTVYIGGESVTLPNGLIFKHGLSPSISANTVVDLVYGTPFPNGIVSMNTSFESNSINLQDPAAIQQKPGSLLSTAELANGSAGSRSLWWQVWGY